MKMKPNFISSLRSQNAVKVPLKKKKKNQKVSSYLLSPIMPFSHSSVLLYIKSICHSPSKVDLLPIKLITYVQEWHKIDSLLKGKEVKA